MTYIPRGHKPNPAEPVRCNACGWHGLIRDAVAPPNALATCPKCGKPVVAMTERLQEKVVSK